MRLIFITCILYLLSATHGYSTGLLPICMKSPEDMNPQMCTNVAQTPQGQQLLLLGTDQGLIVPGAGNTLTLSGSVPFVGFQLTFLSGTTVVGTISNPPPDTMLSASCGPQNGALVHNKVLPGVTSLTFTYTPPASFTTIDLVVTIIYGRAIDASCSWSHHVYTLSPAVSTSTPAVVSTPTPIKTPTPTKPITTPSPVTVPSPAQPTQTPSTVQVPAPVQPTDTPVVSHEPPTNEEIVETPESLGYTNSHQIIPGVLKLYWKPVGSKDTAIQFSLTCKCTGWFAVGWSPNGRMLNSEAVIGYVSSQAVSPVNLDSVTLPDDASPNFNSPLALTSVSGSLVQGTSTIYFTRQIAEGKHPLSAPQIVIGSYQSAGLTDRAMYHGANARSGQPSQVNFITGDIVKAARPMAWKDVHAIVMFIAWAILLSFGVLIARYARGYPNAFWFKTHRVLQYSGFTLSLVGIVIIFATTKVHFNTLYHAQLGVAITALSIAQVIYAFLRPHPPKNKGEMPSRERLRFEWFHWINGRLLILLVIPQVIGGILEIGYPMWTLITYSSIVGVVMLIVIIREIINCVHPDDTIVPCIGRVYAYKTIVMDDTYIKNL